MSYRYVSFQSPRTEMGSRKAAFCPTIQIQAFAYTNDYLSSIGPHVVI